MGDTHFTGPVYSPGGFVGPVTGDVDGHATAERVVVAIPIGDCEENTSTIARMPLPVNATVEFVSMGALGTGGTDTMTLTVTIGTGTPQTIVDAEAVDFTAIAYHNYTVEDHVADDTVITATLACAAGASISGATVYVWLNPA